MKNPVRKITLVLVDDEPLARAGIRAMLSQAEDIEIIGEAHNGDKACQLVEKLQPQVLLLDLKMPGMRAWEVERWVRENHPSTVTLVLTAHHHSAYLAQMIEAGVSGYIKKNASAEELIQSIRKVASGKSRFNPDLMEDVEKWKQEGDKWKRLSKREREIVIWVAMGAMTRFLTEECSITKKTLESHITHVLKKLGLKSRYQIASWLNAYIPEDLRDD